MALSKQDLKARTLAGMEEEERFQKSNEIKGKITKIANVAKQTAASQEARANKEKDLIGAKDASRFTEKYDYSATAAEKRRQNLDESTARRFANPTLSAKAVSSEAEKKPIVPAAQQRRQAVSDQIYENVLKGEAYLQAPTYGPAATPGINNTERVAKGLINRFRSVPGETVENAAYLISDRLNPQNGFKNWLVNNANKVVENNVAGQVGDIADAQLMEAKENTGNFGDFIIDAADAATRMGSNAFFFGAPNLALSQGIGGGLEEYRQQREAGTDKGEALFRGAASGAAGYFIERLGGIGGAKKSLVTALVPGTNKLSTSGVTSIITNIAKNAFDEGGEELTESVVNSLSDVIADMVFKGEVTIDFDLIEALRGAAIGALIGGGFGAASYTPTADTALPTVETPAMPTPTPAVGNVTPTAEASKPPVNATLPNVENVTPAIENNQQVPFANVEETTELFSLNNIEQAKQYLQENWGYESNEAEDVDDFEDMSPEEIVEYANDFYFREKFETEALSTGYDFDENNLESVKNYLKKHGYSEKDINVSSDEGLVIDAFENAIKENVTKRHGFSDFSDFNNWNIAERFNKLTPEEKRYIERNGDKEAINRYLSVMNIDENLYNDSYFYDIYSLISDETSLYNGKSDLYSLSPKAAAQAILEAYQQKNRNPGAILTRAFEIDGKKLPESLREQYYPTAEERIAKTESDISYYKGLASYHDTMAAKYASEGNVVASENSKKEANKQRQRIAKLQKELKDLKAQQKNKFPKIKISGEEIKSNMEDIAKMPSVYNVDKSKLEKTGKKPSEIFADFFKSWGNVLKTKKFGDVSLNNASVKSEVRHGITAEKIASIEAIPSVLKNGEVIFDNFKNKSDVRRVVVCAPIKIGKDHYYMGVMLQSDTQNQRLYLHNVAIEKEMPVTSQADLLTTGADENNEHLFITNILQEAINVKYGQAKNLKAQPSAQGDGGFGANTVGAAQSNPNSYAHLQNEHGVHDLGENPRARDANVPLMDAQGKRTSKSVATIMEAKVTPDELIPAFEREVVAGTFENKGTSNKEAVEKAAKRIADKTFKDAVSDFKTLYSDDKLLSKDDLVYGELLFSMAAQSGEANTAMEIASLLSSNNSRTGDAMQAQRILKRLSPEGRLYHTQRIVEKINKDNKQKNKIVLDEETVNKIINARTDKEIEEASEFAAEKIAKQIDRGFFSDLAGMWNAWRYLSMLGNPKTHIRNIFGNVVFLPVRKVKNVVKAGIEDVAIKAGKLDEKTATIKSVSKETKDFAKRNFEENKKVLLSGGNYRFESEIEAAKKDFYLGGEQTPVKKFFNDVLTPVRKASEFNSNSLEAEDVWFFREAYVDSFGQYLTANGIDAANITNEQRTKAENYAAQEAKKATYRDASALANALEKFSNTKIKVKGNEIKLRPFVDAVLPFRKTPINILSRGIEYSPVGLASSLALDGKAVKNGDITANEMIDHISSGLTGTGIFALGMFLAAKNIVSGGESDDEKEKAFDKLTGEQAYALNIGNGSYTIDWLSPTVLPLFAGVETWKVLQKEYGKDATWDQTAWAIISNLDKIANPMLELSMLSSLEQFLGKNYGKEGSALSGLAQDLLASYVLQAVPTIFSQVAQTMDGTRRNAYYVDKTDNIPDKWQIPLQRAMAKIPGLSQKLPAYVDAWGREQKQSENIGIRALENFASPGYYKKKNVTKVDEMLKQVYVDTGDSSVIPTSISKNFNVNGETVNLSANQYTDAQKTKGPAAYNILSQLVVDKDFKKMSAEDKAEVIKDVYSYATVKGKQKVSDYTTDTKWYKNMEEAQKNENIKPADFLVNRSVYNNLEGTEARSKDMMMYDHLIADKSTSDKEDLAILKYVAGVDFSKYEKATDKPNAILSAYNIIKTEEAKGGEGTQDRIIKQLIADKNTTAKEDLAILENVRSVNFDDYKKAANNNADKTLYLYSLLKSENAKGEEKEKDVDIEAIQKKFKEDVYGAREIYYKAKGDWNEDVSDVLENGTNRDKKVAVFERFKYSDEEITKGYNAVIGLSKKDDMMKALKKAFGNTSKATVFYNILKGKKGYK